MKFANGPKIAVHIALKNGILEESRLTLSDEFACFGANDELTAWLALYGQRKPIPFNLANGTLFQQNVMKELTQIPFGQTISYQHLAALCGKPKGARAIGNACGRNPFPLFIPCHRVIRSNGSTGGFSLDIEVKTRLLDFERQVMPNRVNT